ncbi:MAG: hypothetical protein EHM61_04700 [Acidobacteria bacterium]|nr:MAG: hypothetical protein EHM61_04700 [Acidobacteriota bacterium]
MKSGDSTQELEQALKTLEVPKDASWETIEQAFHELREVWDPKRFEGDERLVRRADEHRDRIAAAYLVLKRHYVPDRLMEEWARHAKPTAAHRPAEASDRPSLVDDLFSAPSTKPAKAPGRSHEEEDQTRNPSLVQDVFAAGPRAARRFPIWLLVLVAITVTVVGSVLVYRSKPSQLIRLAEEERPALEMADPPPVPPPPIETPNPEDLLDETPPVSKGGQTNAPAPPAPVQNPAPATDSRKPAVAKVPGNQAQPPGETETKPGAKPKLLREPEDLAKEQKAFDILREKSARARQLVDGNLEQYRFVEYQVIPKEAGQYWVHIVAELKGTGRATHLIWAVNPDKQTTKPLSQAARDLER